MATAQRSYLGIDVGGTKVGLRFEIGDAEHDRPDAEVLETRMDWPGEGGVDADLAALTRAVKQACADWGRPLSAVGVAMPATVAADGVVTAWPGRPSWVGLDLAAALRGVVPTVPARWADDGDLGALAEARSASCDDLVYLGVGTGVGGGIVVGGQVVPGFTRGSCELGHVIVEIDGPVCDCGRAGCVQAFAGGPAILRRAAQVRGASTTPEELRAAWHAGADWAVQALDRAAVALASVVIGVGEMLHPRVAVIGGGFAAAHDGFVDRIAVHVRRLARPGQPAISVRPATLAGLASLRGAVVLARDTPL
jgi:kanosamine 6-kinase